MKRLLILAGVGLLAAGAHANLIADGGFEMGDVYAGQFDGGLSPWSTQYGYATNANHSSTDPGSIWYEGNMRVMDQDQAANNSFSGHSSWDPVIRSEGRSFLAVNGATNQENQPFVLQQTFNYSGTGPLQISFDSVNLYAPGLAAGTSTIAAWLDGNLLGTTNTQVDNTWRTSFYSVNVTNTGSHTLRIIANTTQASGNDFGLDNVQVNAVPEPFTMSLGLASAGLFLRRRLKAKKA